MKKSGEMSQIWDAAHAKALPRAGVGVSVTQPPAMKKTEGHKPKGEVRCPYRGRVGEGHLDTDPKAATINSLCALGKWCAIMT